MTTKTQIELVKTLLNAQLQVMRIGSQLEEMFDLDIFYILEDAQDFCVGVEGEEVTEEEAISFLSSMTKKD